MATHSSVLAWRIPWTEEPGGLLSPGWQRVRRDLACTHILYIFFFQFLHPVCSRDFSMLMCRDLPHSFRNRGDV